MSPLGTAVLSSWYWCCICRDCETYFGRESLRPITTDDSVVCETQYSKVVPLEGGEVSNQTLNIMKLKYRMVNFEVFTVV